MVKKEGQDVRRKIIGEWEISVEKYGPVGRGEEKSEQMRMLWGPKASHRVSCQNDKWEVTHPSSSSSSPLLPQPLACFAPVHFQSLFVPFFKILTL